MLPLNLLCNNGQADMELLLIVFLPFLDICSQQDSQGLVHWVCGLSTFYLDHTLYSLES